MTESTEPRTASGPAPGPDRADDARRELRRFFVLGPGAGDDAGPAGDLLPAHLAPFRGAGRVRTEYPVYLGAAAPGAASTGDGAAPHGALCLGFDELMDRARRSLEGEGGGVGRVLRDNLKRLEAHVVALLTDRGVENGSTGDARELLLEAGEAMARELTTESDLAETGRDSLVADVERLAAALPRAAAGRLAGPHTGIGLRLLGHALVAGRQALREAFVREARELLDRGRAQLEADRRKGADGREDELQGGAMGALGDRFVDPSALAAVLGEHRGSAALDPGRREKLERAVEALARAAEVASRPRMRVMHDGTVPWVAAAADDQDDWAPSESSDPCAAAAEVFDRDAEALAEALRARERVRLETSGEYEADRHEPWLERLVGLDWRAFDESDVALIDPVVAVESAGELAHRGMVGLSKLLRSGRPVQALVLLDPAADPGCDLEEGEGESRFEPAYLGMSHREAFVQQSSEARPLHLMEGFLRGAASARPALHVVAPLPEVGETPDVPPAVVAGAAIDSRAHPLLRYDPETGSSWAHRLDFSGNPEPASDWPVGEAGVGTSTEERPFTFADFALLDPALRRHLLPLTGDVAEADGLVPVAAWLALPADEALHQIPTVTAVDARGRTVPLAISRRLAAICRDRLGYWRTLQELAGVKSEYVRRAAEATREEVESAARAERERLEAAHAVEVERVRERAAREAVDRLTAALLDVDLGLFAAPPRETPSVAGKTVDEVARTLMDAVGGDLAVSGEVAAGDGAPASEEVDEAARRLLELIDPEDLAESLERTSEPTE